jgi:hypothetical protein
LGRWQVFGGEAMGLGLCAQHGRIPGVSKPEEIVRQILAGTYLRSLESRDSEAMPSLRGLAHTLRKLGHPNCAVDYNWIHGVPDWIEEVIAPQVPGGDGFAAAIRQRRSGKTRGGHLRTWQSELAAIRRDSDRGEDLVEYLRELVRDVLGHQGEATASALSLAEYKAPRQVQGQRRSGTLFIHLAQAYRGGFIGNRGANIKYFASKLSEREPGGVSIHFEGDVPRSRS